MSCERTDTSRCNQGNGACQRSTLAGVSSTVCLTRDMDKEIFEQLAEARGGLPDANPFKVSVVGAGAVGISAAYALLIKNMAKPLVLIDIFEDRVLGEMKDLQHSLSFTDGEAVLGGTDYSLTAGSKVCVITAGKRQKPGQSRIDLLNSNIKVVTDIMKNLLEYSPDAIYIIASNPVDVLTYAAWKTSGLPLNRVIGSGTHIDSSRFKYYISHVTGAPIHCVDAYIIGEHGETSVPVWSHVRIAGQPFEHFQNLLTEQDKNGIHRSVIDSAQEVIKLKGYTSEAVGLALTDIVETIICDKKKAVCVSTLSKGFYGIETETFTSLPCMIGRNGISYVMPPKLSDEECSKLKESVASITAAQNDIMASI